MKVGEVLRLGRMEYDACRRLQFGLLDEVADGRRPDTLVMVEHPPVYTLGANFHRENLPLSPEEYARRGVDVQPTERGGDVTYHGPGQLVVYPIFDLRRHGRDIHKWLRDLEETMLLTLADFGFEARRFPPHTGVWVGDEKVAAIGVKVRRWTSMHGIALNCDNDLTPFEWIVPCGIRGYGVTSLTRLVGRTVTPNEAASVTMKSFEKVFEIYLSPMPSPAFGK
ncbi:MAG: lipoyl(octanoyl) transferase LipB [Fimbriimonadaceae bacterium]